VEKVRDGKQFDLILMDIIMPNLDGISATHYIRGAAQQLPIIAMTSNIRSDDLIMYYTHGKIFVPVQDQADPLGMNDILPKPFTRESLLHLLEKYLDHLKKSHQLDTHPLSATAGPGGAPRIKPDDVSSHGSPQKTPIGTTTTTATWQSPQSVQLSPEGEFVGMTTQNSIFAVPGIPTTPTGLTGFSPQSASSQIAGQRRGIADISGGDAHQQAAKRHQVAQAAAQQHAQAQAQVQAQLYGMGMQQAMRR
jgi:osomolarity two-component system, response regulator SKN7